MSTKVMTRQNEKNRNKIRTMAQIGMLSAIATVLMLFEIPLPFAPSFYEIDFSEVPILIGSFAMGPLAGAAIELIKILESNACFLYKKIDGNLCSLYILLFSGGTAIL